MVFSLMSSQHAAGCGTCSGRDKGHGPAKGAEL